MGQFGFFDADRRLAAITAKGDPLEMIDRVVPFESFRAEIPADPFAVVHRGDVIEAANRRALQSLRPIVSLYAKVA
jgi:hypothetical protein